MRRVLEMGLPTLPVGIRAICREECDLGSRYRQGCGVMLLSPTQLCIPRNRQAHALTGVGHIHQAGFA